MARSLRWWFLLLLITQAWAENAWILAVRTGNRTLDKAVYAEACKALSPQFALWNGQGPHPKQVVEIWIAEPNAADPTPFSLESEKGDAWYCGALISNPPLTKEILLADLVRPRQMKMELRLWRSNAENPEVYRMNLNQFIHSHKTAEDLLPARVQEWMMRLAKFHVATAPKQVAQSFQQALMGKRLFLQGGHSEGWQFEPNATVLRFEEGLGSLGGTPAFTTWIYWIAQDQFLLVESAEVKGYQACPPRVWSYRVDSITDTTVSLRELLVGWDTVKESLQVYVLNP